MLFALMSVTVARAAENPKITMVVAKKGTIVHGTVPGPGSQNRRAHRGTGQEKVLRRHQNSPRGTLIFVVQWGDPEKQEISARIGVQEPSHGVGSGGSGHTVPLEAKMLHEKYTLGLARSAADPDSGDSQVFINKTHQPWVWMATTAPSAKFSKALELVNKLAVGDVITSVRLDTGKKVALIPGPSPNLGRRGRFIVPVLAVTHVTSNLSSLFCDVSSGV